MRPIHIFKAGKHTSAGGQSLDFTEDMLRDIASSYDPALHEAPIVIGHPRDNAPAYGWVSALSVDAEGLHANAHSLNTDFAEAVRAGAYRKVSASLYLPDAPTNPKPGTHYLRHVGFLGAQPPAIKGLLPVNFAEDEEGVIEFTDHLAHGAMAGFFRNFREWVIEKFGTEDADKVAPNYMIEQAADLARPQPEPQPAPSMSYSEDKAMPLTDAQVQELQDRAEKAERERDDLLAKTSDFAEREQRLQQREREQRTATIKAEVGALVKAGKLLPAQEPALIAFMETLSDDATVDFGEGDTATKLPQRQHLLGILSAMPAAIDFGEHSHQDEEQLPSGDNAAVAQAARDYVEQETAKGRTVSFTEAVAHVNKGRASDKAA